MPLFVLSDRHQPHECRSAFAAWKGLRRYAGDRRRTARELAAAWPRREAGRSPGRRRLGVAFVLAGLGLPAVCAGPALGTARVNINATGDLRVAVDAIAGADGNHGLRVEPIFSSGKSFRVGQTAFGVPSIVSSTVDCFTNVVLNDVVCQIGFRRSITVVAGDGNDNVVLFEEGLVDSGALGVLIAAPPTGCEALTEAATVTAEVQAGAGADDVAFQIGSFTSQTGGCPADRLATPRLRLRLSASGGPGADELGGGVRNDTVRGDAGEDVLDGGLGIDTFFGGTENDSLEARDGVRDASILCGSGADFARLDTQDQLTPPFTNPVTGRFNPGSSCETVDQSPLDDGPPGRALRQRLRLRRGRVAVRVACPRRARVACHGVLTLRHPESRRVLARGRYRVPLGRKASVSLRARRRLPRRVAAEMLEQGVSKKGPRFSSRLLAVAR